MHHARVAAPAARAPRVDPRRASPSPWASACTSPTCPCWTRTRRRPRVRGNRHFDFASARPSTYVKKYNPTGRPPRAAAQVPASGNGGVGVSFRQGQGKGQGQGQAQNRAATAPRAECAGGGRAREDTTRMRPGPGGSAHALQRLRLVLGNAGTRSPRRFVRGRLRSASCRPARRPWCPSGSRAWRACPSSRRARRRRLPRRRGKARRTRSSRRRRGARPKRRNPAVSTPRSRLSIDEADEEMRTGRAKRTRTPSRTYWTARRRGPRRPRRSLPAR